MCELFCVERFHRTVQYNGMPFDQIALFKEVT